MATAYTFLTESDVRSRIRDEHLHDITDRDTGVEPPDPSDAEAYQAYQDALNASETVMLSCESMAIAKVKSALAQRYNVAAMLQATGGQRHALLVLHVLNVMVYLLYRRINPRKVPEVVKEDHDETLAWLDRVAAGKEAPDFPPAEPEEDNAGSARFGGGQQIKGHYF